MRNIALAILLSIGLLAGAVFGQAIRVIPNVSQKRVDVAVFGKPFTSYRWDERIMRPVLYPILSSGGSFVTRGFPFETRDGDTIDHPHQVGSSFSYGDVNGIDFWNSSTFRSAEEMKRMGRIEHREIVSVKGGGGSGELVTKSAWIAPNGTTLLFETTRYVFSADGAKRWIDRETTLTAGAQDVTFGDSKEGMFAIHLPSELEQSDQTKVKVTSAGGVVSERGNGSILSGQFFNSEGLKGDKVWGTLGSWAAVSGKIGDEPVTVAMFDHPKNVSYPSRMMVRGYGLLALNPFGQKLFDPSQPERKCELRSGQSITFRHRLLVTSTAADHSSLQKEFAEFAR